MDDNEAKEPKHRNKREHKAAVISTRRQLTQQGRYSTGSGNSTNQSKDKVMTMTTTEMATAHILKGTCNRKRTAPQ